MINWHTHKSYDHLTCCGPSFRKTIAGPEKDLLESFIDTTLPPARPNEKRTLFIEPRIENSYPDLVAIYWTPSPTTNWKKSRLEIDKKDLKILHWIFLKGSLSTEEISHIFPKESREETLSRLRLSGMVHLRNGRWFVTNPKKNYVINDLIAVEAKMSLNSKVIEQGLINTWFAGRSVVLVPKFTKENAHLKKAHQLGLNVITPDDILRRSKKRQPATSYVSWLFNEWVWRSTL